MDMFVSPATRAVVPTLTPSPSDISAALMAAAYYLLDPLARGQAVDTATLRGVMTTAFGGSDADGAWDWKTAYDAGEAATVPFLRKFGRGMRGRAGSAAALLAMLAKVTALLPSHTRRSQESQALQQFSTPIALGFAATTAAAITPADLVLEPSAGTGLLAIFAERVGSGLVLNELADARAALLGLLVAEVSVTQYDAAHIHDHLDSAVRPSVVMMNPPFSVAVLNGRTVLELQDGLQLRRAKIMGAFRFELTGFTDGMVERLKAMGLVSEIIAWKLRLFVPTGANGPAILGALMERYPLVRIADRTAA